MRETNAPTGITTPAFCLDNPPTGNQTSSGQAQANINRRFALEAEGSTAMHLPSYTARQYVPTKTRKERLPFHPVRSVYAV